MTTAPEAPPASETVPATAPRAGLVNVLFTAAILLSALLLFAVQPMVSKMLLPPYGGAAAVWTTSLLFFQTVLLIGYAYAHFAPRLFGRAHPPLHAVLVLVPLFVLPIALPAWAVPGDGVPAAAWLLLVLAAMVGLPFLVLSTTGPLVQAWYSRLGLPRSRDPYFLYAASNVGSLSALIAYPFIVEPALGTRGQALTWAGGYALFAVLIGCCAVVVRRRAGRAVAPDEGGPESEGAPAVDAAEEAAQDAAPPASGAAVTWRRRLLWLALAALPSSLMQGVTTYMSTDVAAVPLLWVIPLALFLGTYIIAFGARRHGWVSGTVELMMIAVLPLVLLSAMPTLVPVAVAMGAAMAMLVLVALACHGLLAADRPEPSRLTEFFMITSLGGALGSLFNGVIAPLVFDEMLEYPIALVASVLVALAATGPSAPVRALQDRRWARLALLALVGAAAVLYLVTRNVPVLMAALLMAAPLCVVIMRDRRVLVGTLAVVSAALVIGIEYIRSDDVLKGRTFFGAYSVSEDDERRQLAHGTTVHGFQLQDPGRRSTPVSYYSETGPVGDLFSAYGDGAANIGVVGLGTGVIAAYGQEGQEFDFMEIDPEMVDVASDPRWFTYLDDCACEVDTRVGDGRLLLDGADEGAYDVIILDAFTSDAIPAHLLTREAMEEFSAKLAPGGVLAVHISNRNLDLAPMLGATAAEAGLQGRIRADANRDDDGGTVNPNAHPSVWTVLAADEQDLAPLTAEGAANADEWRPIPADGPVWTDSYSSLLPLIRW